MKLNPDDPRLTAYTLGELEPGERAAIEAELQNNPECRQAVEEIRRAVNTLSTELAAEPCPALRPEQRQKISEQAQPANVLTPTFWQRPWMATAGIAALAASVLLVVGARLWLGPSKNQPEAAVAKLITPTTQPVVSPVPQPVVAPANDAAIQVVSAPPAERNQPGAVASPVTNFVFGSFDGSTNAPTVVLAEHADALLKTGTVNLANNATAPTARFELSDALHTSHSIDDAAATPPPKVAPTPALSKAVPAQNSADYKDTSASWQPSAGNYQQPGYVFSDGSSAKRADKTAVDNLNQAGRGAGFGGRRGGVGGGGGGGFSGNLGIAGGGGRVGRQYAYQDVVVTETRRTVVYDGDPFRDNFTKWRYYVSPPTFPVDTANYEPYAENEFLPVMHHPLSTFSVDVDSASYANIRRFLNSNRLPPPEAVRIEEMVNYFTYHYPQPKGEDPFAANIEVAGCPWDADHRLVRIGIKGREIPREKRPPSNLVFLIDVSGSMQPAERLPLIKQALRQLVKQMGEGDRVAIVVYASEAGVKLASTPCTEKEKILEVIDSLTAGGSTNGGEGIQEAYRVARENFIKGGVNRVILCTDGDFNVGVTDQGQLVGMIQDKAKDGVFLTTLGVGTDNYKDALMQKLADRGNGNNYYLDTLEEAQKVLISQMNATLVPIAKDVKVQIEFNPEKVGAYRLIGYEKRALRNEDFNNDAKDAGEIGAGHTVTALYEIVPVGREVHPPVDELKYQATAKPDSPAPKTTGSKELLTLKLRYKHPEGDKSRLVEFPVTDNGASFNRASGDFKFAAAVASFGMILRNSPHKGNANYGSVLELAQESKEADESGYRSEFITLVKKAQNLPNYQYR